MYGTPHDQPQEASIDFSQIVERQTGWKCTGYTRGCFCPTCSQRDIALVEHLQRARHG